MTSAYPELIDSRCLEVRDRLNLIWKGCGDSMETLGVKMGYPRKSARKSVSQFFQSTTDPRLSMIFKFSDAMGISVAELFEDLETSP